MTELSFDLEKSKKVSLDEIHKMLGKGNWASLGEYLLANGTTGLKIVFNGRLYYVIHQGIDGQNEILVPTTLQQIIKYGVVNLSSFPKTDFATALLWQFHGNPCEKESLKSGGDGYLRR